MIKTRVSRTLEVMQRLIFPSAPSPAVMNLPPAPDLYDEVAAVTYNMHINHYGLNESNDMKCKSKDSSEYRSHQSQEAARRPKRLIMTFKDQAGEKLVEVVDMSQMG